jgi:hypothetical protein
MWLFWSKKVKKAAGKKRLWEKIGIVVLFFVLILQLAVVLVFPRTDAYAAAVNYIEHNDSLKRELGAIKGFGFTGTGGMAVSSTDRLENALGGTGYPVASPTIRIFYGDFIVLIFFLVELVRVASLKNQGSAVFTFLGERLGLTIEAKVSEKSVILSIGRETVDTRGEEAMVSIEF